MGRDYRVKLPGGDQGELESVFRQARYFQSFDPKIALFILRASGPEKKADFPDAHVSFEAEGFIFCDNLSARKEAAAIFLDLIDCAVGRYDRATVEAT